jgi:hypothetical protein
MAQSCGQRSSLAAQTLFLGASIADFNVNMAWGGRPSQLSVKLIEDRLPCSVSPFNGGDYIDNHFHVCNSDEDCYIDENGLSYSTQDTLSRKKSKEKIVPGKVYYVWTPNGFVSRYWYGQDPGFFGNQTGFDNNGIYNVNNYNISKGFDLINTPTLFRIGNFSFAGLIQSWEKSYDSGGLEYNLTIESLDSILDQCYIILDKHAGAVFGKLDTNLYGSPTSWLDGGRVSYRGKIIEGNIPNVFNVYGFLESMGLGNFGGSNKNDNGISASVIIDALSVLTSSMGSITNPASELEAMGKLAFSPFGRILVKVPQENQTYLRVTPNFTNNYGFGLLPITYDSMGIERCHIALDLSEIPRPPLDFRISEPTISIMGLIQNITSATGSDFYFDTIPATLNGIPYNILKLKTITRSYQPDPRQIEKTIEEFQNSGYSISSSRIGKEKNTNKARVMYLGASQQRLFQSKCYRLAFSQTSYVYHPVLNKFVEFYGNVAGLSAAGQPGKYRIPSNFSTRNPDIVTQLNNQYAKLFNIDEDIKNAINQGQFNDTDPNWSDTGLSGSTRIGNYSKTGSLTKSPIDEFAGSLGLNPRFFPLYKDLISPFFGYKHEEDFQVNTTDGESNVIRRIRPVWMDSWTGQLVVLLDISELPKSLRLPLQSPYFGSTMFTITESEIRAANGSGSFDSYITYCMGKMFSPDLFYMLKKAYKNAGKIIFDNENGIAADKSNAAGQMGQPTLAQPAPNTTSVDYNLFFSQDFLRDLNQLYEFTRDLGKYYGAKYLVKLPEVMSYKDQQYADIQIPGSLTTVTSGGAAPGAIQVYQGSGKIFYSYEIADGAWEEYGNIIDDSIVVGSAAWYNLTDDNGKIQPLLGYNVGSNIDYIAQAICKSDTISLNNYGYDQYELLEMKQAIDELLDDTNATCNDTNSFLYPSLNIAQLNQDDFIIKDSLVPTPDAYGNYTSGSKKLYQKITVEKNLAFLDPINLREAYAIVNTQPISLNSASKFYSIDPNSTVIATASIEDLIVFLKLFPNAISLTSTTSPGSTAGSINIDIQKDAVVSVLMKRITNVIGNNDFLALDSSNPSVNYHTLSPKVAHPYFAAIPLKSNQYCYGPWTNYPDLDKNIIFPDITQPSYLNNAIENLIGGVDVQVKSDFAPWNYGGMSYLDEAALYEIYNEVQYQQILETATLSIPGLPIFGLGSSFIFNDQAPILGSNQFYYNHQLYTVNTAILEYTDRVLQPPISASFPPRPIPDYIPLLDEPTITNIPLTYNIITLSSPPNLIAPIISNISCNISPQNVGTTYSFRTYVQKLGFFNKENTDRIKSAGLTSIKTNKQFAGLNSSFTAQLEKDKAQLLRDISRQNYTTDKFQSGFYGTSPGNILIGGAAPFAYAPVNTLKRIRDAQSDKPVTQQAFEIKYGLDYGDKETNDILQDNFVKGFIRDIRYRTYVGSFMDSEAATALGQGYNLKSAMSWDGIFSPISFYPTKFNSTYSLTKHTRKHCPECGGTGSITTTVYDYKNNTQLDVPYSCPYCTVKKDQVGSSVTTAASSSEVLPPYIITNSNDFSTLLEFNSTTPSIGAATSSDTTKTAGLTIPVNSITLQPIVVPYGEFRNLNVQNDPTTKQVDRCRHCIQVIARGNIPPNTKIGLNINNNLKTLFDPDTGAITTENGTGVNADYFYNDILAQHDRVNPDKKVFPMNQRFFGLRGPLMLHAWGYDSEGFPVPNASDEPQVIDDKGRYARFNIKIEKKSTTTFNKLNNGDIFILGNTLPENNKDLVYFTKSSGMQILNSEGKWSFPDNTQQVTIINISNDLDSTPGPDNLAKSDNAYANLGDIITKQYSHNGSKWVKKSRSQQFYLNWAERPDLWPVGPIDLRWDESRKVWSMNNSVSIYKFVYITLEEDLVKDNDFDETYPAKGFLDDIEYSKEPLPQGYRRLVYVKDKTGFTAPKGIKLLCRYDSDSGFYEPISKPSIVADGIIDTNNKAQINMDYAQGNRSIASPVLLTAFANPLGFSYTQSQRGIFTYIRGQWTLTAIKQ